MKQTWDLRHVFSIRVSSSAHISFAPSTAYNVRFDNVHFRRLEGSSCTENPIERKH